MSTTLVPESFNEAVKAYENNDFAASVVLWERLIEKAPQEPGLWYNKSLAYAALEKTPQAIHALRTALRLGFQGSQAGMILKQLQEESQLKNQHGIWLGPSQGTICLIAVIAVNLFFIFWGLQRLTTQVGYLICCGISFFLALGLFFLSASLGSETHQVDAIIGLTDGPLKRVPSDLAEEWITLKKGTSIHFLESMEGFFLVQTGYGLQGWIKENYLMPVKKQTL